MTHILAHYGSAGEWIPYYSIFYTFDDANHTESMLYLLWNTATNQWDNYDRDETIRLADGKIVEYHRDKWDDALNIWADVRNEYYAYRPDGLLQSLHANEVSSNDVETITIDSSVYSATGQLDSTFLYTWIDDLNFQNLIIRDYNYDQNGNLSSVTSVRSPDLGTTFIAASRQFFEPGDGYYSNDYSFESQEIAQGPDNYWTNWERHRQFTPQANGRVLYVERYLQASPNTSLVPNTIDSVWYRTPGAVGISNPAFTGGLECRFANPFRPGSPVVCTAPDPDALLTFRLYDLNGRLAGVGNALPDTQWRPFFQLADGVYQLGVWQNGVYLGSRKMVWMN